MDVRDQGLTMLWLRVRARGNERQRERMTDYFNRWIKQVKRSERALERKVAVRAPLADDEG